MLDNSREAHIDWRGVLALLTCQRTIFKTRCKNTSNTEGHGMGTD